MKIWNNRRKTSEILRSSVPAATVLLILLTGLSGCASISRQWIFYPGIDPAMPELAVNQEVIETPSGPRISRGLYVRRGDTLIVMFHGNGGTLKSETPPALKYIAMGYSVLLAEYPGYGISTAYRPGEQRFYRDAAALIEYISERDGYDREDIVLQGRSLGSGVATEMALQGMGAALILITPLTSVQEMGYLFQPRWPVNLAVSDNFNNGRKSSRISGPVLIIHGNRDDTVPYDMGLSLAKSFPDSELITIQTSRHSDFYLALTSAVWDEIDAFIQKIRR